MHAYPPKVVTSNQMEADVRHGDIVWAVEFRIMEKKPVEQQKEYSPDIMALLQKYQKVFGDIPLGRPPNRGFEHIIELEEGVQVIITTPYWHPKSYKDEIEKTIREFLALGLIQVDIGGHPPIPLGPPPLSLSVFPF